MDCWRGLRPADTSTYRDVGLLPPAPVSGDWIASAFTQPERRDAAMCAHLAESDVLTAEIIAADLIVIGAPMYNFGIPAPLKAWIDNIVRVGVTFGFDRARQGEPYWPMLPSGKRMIILTARGDYGYGPGERLADINLVEAGLRIPMAYIGLTDTETIAVEYDEFADERLAASLLAAETTIDQLVDRLAGEYGESMNPAKARRSS